MNAALQLYAVWLLLADLRYGFLNSETSLHGSGMCCTKWTFKCCNMPENVALLSDILLSVGALFVGPLFRRTCWTCPNPPLQHNYFIICSQP